MHGTHPASAVFFFFNDTATTEIYTLSLHDALPICAGDAIGEGAVERSSAVSREGEFLRAWYSGAPRRCRYIDRKSTRLNSSHANISYAVFCLKKKQGKKKNIHQH